MAFTFIRTVRDIILCIVSAERKTQRKVIFDQKLRLLSMVGENYKKAGEIEISEGLKTAPL